MPSSFTVRPLALQIYAIGDELVRKTKIQLFEFYKFSFLKRHQEYEVLIKGWLVRLVRGIQLSIKLKFLLRTEIGELRYFLN